MKPSKFVLRIVALCLAVLAFIFTVGFASHKQSIMPCSGISIVIGDSSGSGFVSESDIAQTIQNKFGTLAGKPLSSINMSLLEKIINTNPFIYDAEVFSTVDGKINIDVKQRIPVLRVINNKNESFYIDRDGFFMPPSEKYTARVPVATGFIFDREAEKKVLKRKENLNDTSSSSSRIEQLFNIVSYTNQSEFWSAAIQQLYVNANGEIEFIPRVGNHTVIIGDDQLLDTKFTKLLLFYREGLNKKGWDKYSTINLKYKNQVVCTKK
jgi:cell division protein FtsQ